MRYLLFICAGLLFSSCSVTQEAIKETVFYCPGLNIEAKASARLGELKKEAGFEIIINQ